MRHRKVPSRKSKHINESDCQQIEHWRLKGVSVAEIAMLLQRHRSTIYRELKRGTIINKRSDLFTLIHFHHLNEEATRMQTVSSGAYYPRKQLSIRLLKTISTVWPNGWTVIHVVSSTDNLHAQRHASKTFILSNLPLNQKKNSYCRIWSCNSATGKIREN